MAKERTELRHRTAAMVDPLTGISSRRAFMQEAATIAERHCRNPKPATVLLIDLDHFKSVNDRFGHAVGCWKSSPPARASCCAAAIRSDALQARNSRF
jgi:diguanylate cyclase (GGDEF)-like protein